MIDKQEFRVTYREPIVGGMRQASLKTNTLIEAINLFNTLDATSLSRGQRFETPMRIEYIASDGTHLSTWTTQSRYDVPRLVFETDV